MHGTIKPSTLSDQNTDMSIATETVYIGMIYGYIVVNKRHDTHAQ